MFFLPYVDMGIAPLVIAAIVGAALAAKKNADAQKQAGKDRKTQAQIAAYSPWTGMQAAPVKGPGSMFGDMAQGAVGGMGVGQMVEGSQNAEAMQQKQGGLVDAQTNYYNSMANQGGSAGAMNGPANSSQEDPFVLQQLRRS